MWRNHLRMPRVDSSFFPGMQVLAQDEDEETEEFQEADEEDDEQVRRPVPGCVKRWADGEKIGR